MPEPIRPTRAQIAAARATTDELGRIIRSGGRPDELIPSRDALLAAFNARAVVVVENDADAGLALMFYASIDRVTMAKILRHAADELDVSILRDELNNPERS